MSPKKAAWLRGLRWSRRTLVTASLAATVVVLAALLWLLRPRPIPTAGAVPVNAPATVTIDEADLKAAPSAASATVAKLPRGTRLQVRAEKGVWNEVRTAAASGFLPAVTFERDSDREARARRAGTILAFPPVSGVVAEDTDLLLAPFPMAARAGRLEKGTTVQIYSVDHAYYALRGSDGGLAFVDSASIDVVPPDPKLPPIVPAPDRTPKDLEVRDMTEAPAPLPDEEQAAPADHSGPPPSGAATPPAEAAQPLEPATLVSKVDPVYPEAARRAGVEGTVVLEATIGPDGRVTRVDVLRGLPFGLSEAAAAAVARWQYRPARGRDGPTVSRKEVRIEFRLRS